MPMTLFNRTKRCACSLSAACLLLAFAGCNPNPGAQPGGPTRQREAVRPAPTTQEALQGTESIILDVVAYYSTPIRWRWNENKTRVHGLIIGAVYLMGPSGRGVFGDGTIHPRLLVRDRTIPEPEQQWQQVKEWKYTPEEMWPFRRMKPTVQGYGYLLPLDWSDLNMDLSGREIRVVIGYERTDGMPPPRPSSKDLVVPLKGS